MKKVLCIAFLVFLLSASMGFSQEIPTLHKYVNDYAGVLSPSDAMRINDLCSEIENNWTVEIAVLTVNTTQPMSIDEYAVETFQNNGIGKKDTNNGLLIVVAIDDRTWRFEVGYGLEPIITDATAGRIGRAYIVPYFQNESYGDGLYYAVDAVGKVIQNSGDDSFISDQTLPPENIFDNLLTVFIILLPFLFIIIPIIAYKFTFPQKCPKCGTRMKCHYEGDNNLVGGDGYTVCECPKCGKKIKKKRKRNFFFFVGGLGGGGFGGGGGGGGGFGGGGSGGGGASGGW